MDVTTERTAVDRERAGGNLSPEPARAVADVATIAARIADSVGSVLAGCEQSTETSLACLFSGGHLLIEDIPGVGKTLLAQALAASVGGSFHRIQGTPDLLPGDVTGTMVPHGDDGFELTFRHGPIFSNLVVFDELNRANPRTQSALLEATEEAAVTIDGETRDLPKPFLLVATQNPIEMIGTYPLGEGALDRFAAVVTPGRASAADEVEVLTGRRGRSILGSARPVVDIDAVEAARGVVREVYVADAIARYVVALLDATREHPRVRLGASTRGGVALVGLAKARAAINGRHYVVPDDVIAMARPALAHRVLVAGGRRLGAGRPSGRRRVPRPGPAADRMIRPVGVSAGGVGLLLAWLGGVAIAQVTGATPVVIVLAAGFVLFAAAIVDGFLSIQRTHVGEITLPHSSVQGEPATIIGEVGAPRPVWIEIHSRGREVALGWTSTTVFAADAAFERRGPVDQLDVRVRSAGLLGLVWWGRRYTVDVDRHLVAPPARYGAAPVERVGTASDGDLAGAAGAVSGEIDGVRPWRDGDSKKFVHWASTLRSGELMVHDRRQNADQRWVVRARSDTAAPDAEAGAARWAMEQGLRSGVSVMAAVDSDEPVVIDSVDAATEWAALADLGTTRSPHGSWRDRFRRVEPDATATMTARWWSAASTLVALLMLAGALGYSIVAFGLIAVGAAAGAAVSGRSLVTGDEPSALIRALVGLGAVVGFGMVVAASGRLDGVLALLRGPLPQVLMILILLHGFECRDRRTIRVSLGISAVVLMYASGLRVDGAIGWWLLAWAITFGLAIAELAGPTEPSVATRSSAVGAPLRSSLRSWGMRLAGIGGGALTTVAVLAIVPIPDGPARLTLPTLIENAADVGSPGAIAGPDGEIRDTDNADATEGERAPAGRPGGYFGFADSMDTSVRGNLSDEIVMRVRAPEPDFWRGQTFARFDGRRWYADDDDGSLRRGPNIEIPPALGDIPVSGDVEVDRFVQTYFLETDMPNIVFHASRPNQVIVEADVWVREDGALRASTVIPDGSIYTVVSDRVRVDAEILGRQRLIQDRLTQSGEQAFERYLQVPDSTTPETIALAAELAAGKTSTYEVIREYEAWMGDNVEYDLNAPLPAAGEDAVHDFLFDTKLGFCEQIASSLTIMLRTQGVPARLTAGYVSGTRDEVAGVYEVRASDAHAWVEVWFPETGWQSFDPTAAVPLSANAEMDSVGADLLGGAGGYVADNPIRVLLVVGLGVGGATVVRLVRVAIARRRRGRWGTLQDRFAMLAGRRGASGIAPNPALAQAWSGADDEAVARLVADRLDRVAFDPAFADEDDVFSDTRRLVGTLSSR